MLKFDFKSTSKTPEKQIEDFMEIMKKIPKNEKVAENKDNKDIRKSLSIIQEKENDKSNSMYNPSFLQAKADSNENCQVISESHIGKHGSKNDEDAEYPISQLMNEFKNKSITWNISPTISPHKFKYTGILNQIEEVKSEEEPKNHLQPVINKVESESFEESEASIGNMIKEENIDEDDSFGKAMNGIPKNPAGSLNNTSKQYSEQEKSTDPKKTKAYYNPRAKSSSRRKDDKDKDSNR